MMHLSWANKLEIYKAAYAACTQNDQKNSHKQKPGAVVPADKAARFRTGFFRGGIRRSFFTGRGRKEFAPILRRERAWIIIFRSGNRGIHACMRIGYGSAGSAFLRMPAGKRIRAGLRLRLWLRLRLRLWFRFWLWINRWLWIF